MMLPDGNALLHVRRSERLKSEAIYDEQVERVVDRKRKRVISDAKGLCTIMICY